MTTFFFPSITPTQSRWQLKSNTGVQVSPHTGATKTISRGGERWVAELQFINLTGDEKAVMKAFYTRLLGQTHRFYLRDHSSINRGAFGGSPLVAGASQTGSSIDIDGLTGSVTDWIRQGDMFSVNGELKMAVRDQDSLFDGTMSLDFEPRLRTSPADNDPIVTTNPEGIFLLEADEASWTNKPGDFSDFVIRAVEDIAA